MGRLPVLSVSGTHFISEEREVNSKYFTVGQEVTPQRLSETPN